jgi:DNA-directed RNA polymerase alpha subunit
VEIEDTTKCNLCIECYRFAETLNLEKSVVITETDDHFNFKVESTGALPPKEIVRKALIILKNKIERFQKEMLESVDGSMAMGVQNPQYY